MLLTTAQNDPLLGNHEAAAYLGVTPHTLDIWRAARRYGIPYVKVGRLVKYRLSSLDAWLATRTVAEPK